MSAAVGSIELESPAYQAMLERYIVKRLQLNPAHRPDDQELIEAILCAADRRFAYVSFLTERCERGKEDRASLAQADSGQTLYTRWLNELDLEYGRELAGRMRQVLALLGAAQQAHDWVFDAGRIEDPATGGVLTLLDETFRGLPLGVLQTLLMLDRPGTKKDDERFDPNLLQTLQQLQGVLSIHRGDSENTRFLIALKDFGPVMDENPELEPMRQMAHARIATAALDALTEEQEAEVDWPLFSALAGLLDACVQLSGSEPVVEHWRSGRPRAIELIQGYDDRCEAQGHTLTRFRWLTQLARWDLASDLEENDARDQRLSSRLMNRGIARSEGGDLAGAVADYDAAIGLMEAIQKRQLDANGEDDWSLPLRNDLAGIYMNRGSVRSHCGDLAGAVADYDAALELREAIREQQLSAGGEDAWSLLLSNDLASVYSNRGIARSEGGDLTGAVADYDAAIGLMEAIRERQLGAGGEDAWSLPLRNDLASVYSNRGSAWSKGGDLAEAVADYDAAIGLMEAIRERQLGTGGEDAWSLLLRNDLASVYSNRGIARSDGGDLAGAVADYDAAIGLMEAIRERQLGAGGEDAWSLPLRNDLASVYTNRGIARFEDGDLTGAVADYDAAIGLMEAIQGQPLGTGDEDAWSLPLHNDLANIHMNRGIARSDSGDWAGAVADYGVAIELREEIRVRQLAKGGEEAWSLPLRQGLLKGYQLRFRVRLGRGHLKAFSDLKQVFRVAYGIAQQQQKTQEG